MKAKRGWREILEEEAALARLAQSRAVPAYRPAPPVNHALKGSSAWLRLARRPAGVEAA